VREPFAGPRHHFAAVLKAQQPVETVIVQVMEKEVI
jgi:hypothetical protein